MFPSPRIACLTILRQSAELRLDRVCVCICTSTAGDGCAFNSHSAAETDRAAPPRPVHGKTVYIVVSGVKRAADATTAPVQHVGVDHRGTHVFVAQELLDGTDVRAWRRRESSIREHTPAARPRTALCAQCRQRGSSQSSTRDRTGSVSYTHLTL